MSTCRNYLMWCKMMRHMRASEEQREGGGGGGGLARGSMQPADDHRRP